MADNPCFLFGCVLDGNGGAKIIEGSATGQAAQAWAHLDFSAGDARGWLAECGLDSRVIDTLIREESRSRAIATNDGLLVVLRGINRNAGGDPEDMVSLRIWLEADRLISVRQRQVMTPRLVLAELKLGTGPRNTDELLTQLIEHLTDGVAVFVDKLEERMEQYEDTAETAKPASVRAEVSAIRRQVASVRRFLAPQREALEALCRLAEGRLTPDQLYLIREQSDRTIRYVEDLDLVRERALVAQEELLNRIAQEQNSRAYLLSIVAAIFLPISFITGMFGMNVGGLPGIENATAFWIVCGGMLAIAAGIVGWMRFKRWL